MFKDGTFQTDVQLALTELEGVIENQNSPPEVIGRVAVGVINQLFTAFQGFGSELTRLADSSERLAVATEALQQFAAVDINATIEQAIAAREDNIAESAVANYKENSAARKFLGKTT